MKGFLACALAALPTLAQGRLARPIHLAFSYDEEIGCQGVQSLIEHVRKIEMRPELCVVGEPTEMRPVIGHKGGRAYKVRVRGKEAHSSLAPQAVNAVEYAAHLIVFLTGIANDFVTEGPRDEAFDVVHTTIQTGLIRGGTAINVVPRDCEFVFEFRHLAETDPDNLVNHITEFALTKLEPRMRAIDRNAGISFEPIYRYPALATPREDAAVALVKALAECSNDGKVAFGTEGGLFSEIGVPTVVCGPGSIVQAHKPDEFVTVDQIRRCEAFLSRLIDEWAMTPTGWSEGQFGN
jgi:acetylornithine deacetylase